MNKYKKHTFPLKEKKRGGEQIIYLNLSALSLKELKTGLWNLEAIVLSLNPLGNYEKHTPISQEYTIF